MSCWPTLNKFLNKWIFLAPGRGGDRRRESGGWKVPCAYGTVNFLRQERLKTRSSGHLITVTFPSVFMWIIGDYLLKVRAHLKLLFVSPFFFSHLKSTLSFMIFIWLLRNTSCVWKKVFLIYGRLYTITFVAKQHPEKVWRYCCGIFKLAAHSTHRKPIDSGVVEENRYLLQSAK